MANLSQVFTARFPASHIPQAIVGNSLTLSRALEPILDELDSALTISDFSIELRFLDCV
jgi:hypothetical protein